MHIEFVTIPTDRDRTVSGYISDCRTLCELHALGWDDSACAFRVPTKTDPIALLRDAAEIGVEIKII